MNDEQKECTICRGPTTACPKCGNTTYCPSCEHCNLSGPVKDPLNEEPRPKFTPKPWKVTKYITSPEWQFSLEGAFNPQKISGSAEENANGRLIEAAPDAFDVCKSVARARKAPDWEPGLPRYIIGGSTLEDARAVITKVEDEGPEAEVEPTDVYKHPASDELGVLIRVSILSAAESADRARKRRDSREPWDSTRNNDAEHHNDSAAAVHDLNAALELLGLKPLRGYEREEITGEVDPEGRVG